MTSSHVKRGGGVTRWYQSHRSESDPSKASSAASQAVPVVPHTPSPPVPVTQPPPARLGSHGHSQPHAEKASTGIRRSSSPQRVPVWNGLRRMRGLAARPLDCLLGTSWHRETSLR
ncbi:hypothetical protein E3N88_13944 [Mikania micrantha]|uniref:Uncharacterized protein n=1 Tax=Mikania micrantha TaxID=192012 RepID=A0A5N6P022_9ASTR|nr:hypothetical protein E3N88_13944 [Mikania micrantha]